ncbi:peptidase, M23/M37 family [Archangium gephyra]|uniref:Peptidase, M23/M37 family n=1 Tax=Archangium gephyra TaxID=48 RepID=A0AAC8Q5K7_9BACT|nr:peptidase, M23/M37 family [Archangium gephyra]
MARKQPKTGKIQPHRGEDWAAAEGTDIPAAADGKVVYKGWVDGYGNLVVLEHQIRDQTVHTLYAHMNVASPLTVGAEVKARQTVGTVGMTGGVSSGNHLHFEVMPGARPGAPNLARGHPTVDPSTFDFPGEQEEQGRGPWSFPFEASGREGTTDGGTFLGMSGGKEGALSRTHDGFYPVGANGLWHGGIHFDAGSGTLLDQRDGVRCISDGEVVAYLVNKKYPEIQFLPSKKRAAYSTGFTLVRHRLELPEEKPQSKEKPGAKEKPKEKPEAKKEALVFYSLYMHQLDWQGYQERPKLARPGYWGEPKHFRVGEKAKDKQELPPPPPVTPQGNGLTLVNSTLAEFEGLCGLDDAGEELEC